MKVQFFNGAPSVPFGLFMSGFGVLPSAFAPKKPIAMVYDYRDFNNLEEICTLATNAQRLIAWSMGVAIASRIFTTQGFDRAIAINGTIAGIDSKFGIHPRLFRRTIEGFDREVFARGCFGEDFGTYLSSKDMLIEELCALESFCTHTPPSYLLQWHEAYVSENDAIFSPIAQRLAWESYAKTNEDFILHTLTYPHFVFGAMEVL